MALFFFWWFFFFFFLRRMPLLPNMLLASVSPGNLVCITILSSCWLFFLPLHNICVISSLCQWLVHFFKTWTLILILNGLVLKTEPCRAPDKIQLSKKDSRFIVFPIYHLILKIFNISGINILLC